MNFKTVDFLTHVRQRLLESPSLGPHMSGVFLQTLPDMSYPYITLEWHKTSKIVDRAVIHFSLKLWSLSKGLQEMEELSLNLRDLLENSPFPSSDTFPYPFSLRQTHQETTHDPQGVRCFHLSYQAFFKRSFKRGPHAA